MNTAPVLAYSKVAPLGSPLPNNKVLSIRRFNKHLVGPLSSSPKLKLKLTRITTPPLKSFSSNASNLSLYHSISPLPSTTKTHLFKPIRCSYSNTTSPESQNPLIENLKNISFHSIKETLSRLTPIDICKWSLVFSVIVAVSKWTLNIAFNPFVWMYFSWSWLFWPWYVAIVVAIYGLYCLRKHLKGEANVIEQVAIVTSAFTWLTLVPPAYFNGFLEGWPFVFFFVYHYFFFFNVSVRNRMYGDLYPREHDPKWDISLPNWQSFLFSIGVIIGHWFAAYEGPELHLLPSGSINVWIWVLIMLTIFMQYHSTLYLAKYSERVVEPTAVVQFGPYRFVRHPIYASTMLLFVTYFAALRAPISALFIVTVCVVYYEQKAKLEEALMLETFGRQYIEYAKKVRYKFIPFVY
ncbi:hypothetical protein LguiA_012074 [Lonicera macranthoides]